MHRQLTLAKRFMNRLNNLIISSANEEFKTVNERRLTVKCERLKGTIIKRSTIKNGESHLKMHRSCFSLSYRSPITSHDAES